MKQSNLTPMTLSIGICLFSSLVVAQAQPADSRLPQESNSTLVAPVPDLDISYRNQKNSQLYNVPTSSRGVAIGSVYRTHFEQRKPEFIESIEGLIKESHQSMKGLKAPEALNIDVSSVIGSNAFSDGYRDTMSVPLYFYPPSFYGGLDYPENYYDGSPSVENLEELLNINTTRNEFSGGINLSDFKTAPLQQIFVHEYGHQIFDANVKSPTYDAMRIKSRYEEIERQVKASYEALSELYGRSISTTDIDSEILIEALDDTMTMAKLLSTANNWVDQFKALDSDQNAYQTRLILANNLDKLRNSSKYLLIDLLDEVSEEEMRELVISTVSAIREKSAYLASIDSSIKDFEPIEVLARLYGRYNEFFADLFQALILSDNYNYSIYQAKLDGYFPVYQNPYYSLRNFNVTNIAYQEYFVDDENGEFLWTDTEEYTLFAPVRSFLGQKLDGRTLNADQKSFLLKVVISAINEDVAFYENKPNVDEEYIALGHLSYDINFLKAEEMNIRLIERLTQSIIDFDVLDY